MKNQKLSGWGSVAVHGGHKKDPSFAHLTPLYASSTYIFDSAEQGMRRFTGQEEGYIYGRWGNPTITEAEQKIAALETFGTGKEATAILHSSGMAAITTLMMSTLSQGDKILSHFSLYGGTDELVHRIGADFIVHSTTKFLNGHGTAIGGALVGVDIERMRGPIFKFHKTTGANSNAFDAFLLVQGMKTLEVRMDRHCTNGERVAKFLSDHKNVAKVNYTSLPQHPDFAVAAKQMRHAGALLSFEVKGGLQGGINFMNKLNLCTRAVSLGTCDTLLSHPASMTHFSVPKEIADLEQALQ